VQLGEEEKIAEDRGGTPAEEDGGGYHQKPASGYNRTVIAG
jgi:hypothetical protein